MVLAGAASWIALLLLMKADSVRIHASLSGRFAWRSELPCAVERLAGRPPLELPPGVRKSTDLGASRILPWPLSLCCDLVQTRSAQASTKEVPDMFKKFATAALAVTFLVVGSAQAAILEFGALLTGDQETPPTATTATGSAFVLFDDISKEFVFNLSFTGLTAPVVASHVHTAPVGVAGAVAFDIAGMLVDGTGKSTGIFAGLTILSATQELALKAGDLYFNLHTATFPGGEIRGQILPGSVTIVPLPGAVLLLGSAFGGLLLTRRRAA